MSRRNTTYSNQGGRSARAAHARGRKEFSKYDTSAIMPQKRFPVPIWAVVLVVVVLIVAIVFAVSSCSKNENLVPDGQEVEVTFAKGALAPEFGDTLYNAGLINSTGDFDAAVRAKDASTQLKPGTYTFVGGTSADEIVDKLIEGPGVANGLVVPEGNTIEKTAQAVEEAYNGSITAEQFTKVASNAKQFKEEFPFVADAYDNSLEGFLFPKTYEVIEGNTAEDVVRQMLTQYQEEVKQLDYSYARKQGLSEYDVLILASIVEREAASDNQKEVASVFYNRLADDMALQSDATTAYVVGGDPTPDDLKVDGPYNTYLNKGLCKGPICSPGISCLQAVCNPAQTNYLYFVFYPNDDGGMDYFFSETYEEHQKAIEEHAPND